MKTKIENEQEFTAAIDQYGEALAAIDARKAEADVLKQMLEAYALTVTQKRAEVKAR